MSALKSVPRLPIIILSAMPLVTSCAGDKRTLAQRPVPALSNPSPCDANISDGSGCVIVEFEVDTEGGTRNIRIVDSQPPGEFDAVMIENVAKWKFEPARLDGKPVPAMQRVKYIFKQLKPQRP